MSKILFRPNQFNQQRQHDKTVWIYPVMLAMYATYLKNQGHDVIWDKNYDDSYDDIITSEKQIDVGFKYLPHADRILTDAFNSRWQSNGNFKYNPATYIMASNLCWYRKCTFCVETKSDDDIYTREVGDVINEIEICQALGFKEIFDDSGTFPIGSWLDEFCMRMAQRKDKIVLGCNMRIIKSVDFFDMKRAGFRMVLFGMESINQPTLDRLNKGIKAEDIVPVIRHASEAGLEPHIACMTGYPWETYEDEMRTIETVQMLLRKGWAKTAQASLYSVPNEPKMDKGIKHMIYDIAFFPDFWISKIRDIRRWEDFLYLLKSIRKGVKRD
jgi:radical SAM superfamily enzyme YgiQ (UPF0313 family)